MHSSYPPDRGTHFMLKFEVLHEYFSWVLHLHGKYCIFPLLHNINNNNLYFIEPLGLFGQLPDSAHQC